MKKKEQRIASAIVSAFLWLIASLIAFDVVFTIVALRYGF